MSILQVGQPYAPITGRPEGVIFDIDDTGAKLIYNFRAPTDQEVAAMGAGNPFEIRFVELDGILWILSRCGSLSWTDAPYEPHLSANLTELRRPEEGQGLGLTLMMTDADTTVIRSLRLIGLGTKFSLALIDAAERLQVQPFSVQAYSASLRGTMARYTTRQLVSMAGDYFRLKG